MNTYIYYHGNCPDGFGSAWSAHNFLGDNSKIKYIPISYGSDFSEVENGSCIYMLDFSTDADTLRKLGKKNRIIVLDHHKTAQENLTEFETLSWNHDVRHEIDKTMPFGVFVRFDMEKSGAMLSWEFFNPYKSVPNLIKYVQDRDLWKHKLEGTKEFSSHLKCYNFDFQEWDKINELTKNNLGAFIKTGKILLIQDKQNIDMICRQAKLISYKEHKVVVVNATSHWSDIGDSLVKKYPDADYALLFYYSRKSKLIKISLRCKEGFDVSKVASRYGGGGHLKASGYILKGLDIYIFMRTMEKADEIVI